MGDFDRDGHLDLAVVGSDSNDNGVVSILLGQSDGSFLDARDYAVATNPISVAVGDFNGDGYLDLAVANYGEYPRGIPGNVSVLLGEGDGSFQAAHSFDSGGIGPSFVAVGDFNGDGHLDLAVTNSYYPYMGTVSILRGQGDGTFLAAQDYSVPYAVSVSVGDFSGDGHLDLAVAGGWGVTVLRGNGDGTFQAGRIYVTGYDSGSTALGDFDHDGTLDLAIANGEFGTVSILLGQGDGTFQAAQNYVAGDGLSSVVVGDFNGDRTLDLAVADQFTGTVTILLGQGSRTFLGAQNYAVGGSDAYSVAVGDFNGDGISTWPWLTETRSVFCRGRPTAPSRPPKTTPRASVLDPWQWETSTATAISTSPFQGGVTTVCAW
jgi:hypothetical protein